MSFTSARRPLGITLLALLFAFGTSMCALTIKLLLTPRSPLAGVWAFNPAARDALQALGPWAIVVMLVVGTACAAAASGLWQGRPWGRVIAIGLLATNAIGDLFNIIVRHDYRALIGLPIAALLVLYLQSRSARNHFE